MRSEFQGGEVDKLAEWRAQIDRIDKTILGLLTERFRITEEVGHYKAERGMSGFDPAREQAQMEHIELLSEQQGLRPDVAQGVFGLIRHKVNERHDEIREELNPK